MTWDALRGALAAHGLLRAETGTTDDVCPVAAVTYDSRQASAGHAFVALRGQHADGTVFASDAVARGASLVVSEQPAPASWPTPWIEVTDARRALAALAAVCAGHPSHELGLVGITGTNGKTTTAYLLASIFEAAGWPSGVMGTVGYRIGADVRAAARTTPEAPDVQSMLREMVAHGCKACVMEVSSHALALHRVDDLRFAAAVFTNLTRDHLDFHGDMDSYFRAKARLFDMLPAGAPAVINLDDPRGAGLAAAAARPVTYAVGRQADVTPGPLAYSLDGLSFDAHTPRGTVHVRSRLVGRPNVSNILAAVAAADALGLPLPAIEAGLAALAGVPGRFEVVSDQPDQPTVVVDYAHTDDALRNLLETARPLTAGRLITVFGCGGNRDRTKRPLMGVVATRLSDVVVVTSDNPRLEDPRRIIDEVLRGVQAESRSGHEVRVVLDRGEAIATAIGLARPGDVVLIAGKGHEKYQEIGGVELPFDDVAVAKQALAQRTSKTVVS